MKHNESNKVICNCPRYKKRYLAEVLNIAGHKEGDKQQSVMTVICPARGGYHFVEATGNL